MRNQLQIKFDLPIGNRLACLVLASLLLVTQVFAAEPDLKTFRSRIEPLLKQYCYDCQKVVETGIGYDGEGEGYRACAICGNATWFKLFPILGICVVASVIALTGYSAIIGKPKWLRGK